MKKEVKFNGIRQNVFVDDTVTSLKDIHKQSPKTYMSLENKIVPNGFLQELEEKDYPITSESVTSYADGADYRRDPAQAVANAPKRVNLGDVRDVQNFISENPQEAVRQYRKILDDVFVYLKQAEGAAGKDLVSEGDKVNETV